MPGGTRLSERAVGKSKPCPVVVAKVLAVVNEAIGQDEMKPKLLDLFCGAGGASMGLYRAGFEVEGVDIKPQPHYPFRFYQVDALTFPLDGYDAYWASPPCQAYMPTNKYGQKQTNHPRLIEPIRERLQGTGKLYIIENIYKAPLKANLMLCGTMFGLRVIRHRYFECSFTPPLTLSCNHWGQVAKGEFIGVYARGGRGPRRGVGRRDGPPLNPLVTPEEAMGIDWMTKYELTQAIPPAYSEFLGRQLIKYCSEVKE